MRRDYIDRLDPELIGGTMVPPWAPHQEIMEVITRIGSQIDKYNTQRIQRSIETKARITKIAMRLMSNDYAPGSVDIPRNDIDALIELAVLTVNDPTIEKFVVAALETVVTVHKNEGCNTNIHYMAVEALRLLLNTASSDVRAIF